MSLTLDQGKTLGIVGESGSGKTVLSRAIMGLLPRASTTQTGSVRYDGTEILNAPNDELRKLWSTHIAMVFQDPMTSLNPVQRIGNQITEPLQDPPEALARARPRRRRSRSSCRWASPPPSSATRPTRSSSRAACANAS